MAVKIDLEKAYDRVEWDFLEVVLQSTGFDDHFVTLIMQCTSTDSLSILWNGEKLIVSNLREAFSKVTLSHLTCLCFP